MMLGCVRTAELSIHFGRRSSPTALLLWRNTAPIGSSISRRFAAPSRNDVFVFTLGLTEGWVSRADGAAFPLCPGVAGGTFDPAKHVFLNLRVNEVIDDLQEAI